MKRTKSMIYKETQESRKLFLYATNSDDLYRSMITGTINNLKKKAIKGQYDREKAVDAYYYITCKASEMYKKDLSALAIDSRQPLKWKIIIGMMKCFMD